MPKYLLYLLITFLLLAGNNGRCAGKFNLGNIKFKGAVVVDPPAYGDFKTLVVPIKRAGNLIIIEAQIDSIEGNFVLDTGAPYLVLNATYFRDSPKVEDQESGGINGESVNTFSTVIHDFSILDLHYSRITADVTDLSNIENGRGIKILGLLGTRLFAQFAITVDLAHNLLYIQKVDKKGNVPLEEQLFKDEPYLKTPFKYLHDAIFLRGNVNDRPMWFVFDTGAETNLLDYSGSKKALKSMEIISTSKIKGIGGTGFEVLYARFQKLTINNKDFLRNRVLITSLQKMGRVYDQSIDGILGYDFFSRGTFTINFVKNEMEMYIYNTQ